MTLAAALAQKDVTVICLAVLTVGKEYPLWASLGSNQYSVDELREVTAVRYNGETLTNVAAVGSLVDMSWTWDGETLTIQLETGETPNTYENTTQAEITFRFGNHSKEYGGRFYQKRFDVIPNMSCRIEDDFGGDAQISGGSVSLVNADGFFDDTPEWRYDAGEVRFVVGCDTPYETMADADYENSGRFMVRGWRFDDSKAQFSLIEPKNILTSPIHRSFLTKDEYEYLNEGDEGRVKPIALGRIFGAAPPCINIRLGQFMLANHSVTRVDSIRIETETGYEEVVNSDISEATGIITLNTEGIVSVSDIYASPTNANTYKVSITSVVGRFPVPSGGGYEVLLYNSTDYSDDPEADPEIVRFRLTDKSERSISFGWGAFAYTSSIMELTMTADPDVVIPSLAGKVYKIKYIQWRGEKIAVDFHGRRKADGFWMNNASDMIRDLLQTYYGVTDAELNLDSFTESERALEIGHTPENSDDKKCIRVPSLYLDEVVEGMEVISRINKLVGSFLFVNRDGEWVYKVFRPIQGKLCQTITDDELTGFQDISDESERPVVLRGNYARRVSEDWGQIITYTFNRNRYVANLKYNNTRDYDLDLSTRRETLFWLQRYANIQGQPKRKHSFTMTYTGFTVMASDQILLKHYERGIDGVFIVHEVSWDYNNLTVSVVIGNRMGWGDTCGFFTASTDVLPASLAGEVGYNAGSMIWDDGQSEAVSNYKIQNSGYWTYPTGFIDNADSRSRMKSRWI